MRTLLGTPRWAKAAGAVGLTFALLLGVVSAGVRIPGLSMLFPLRSPASLDYSGPIGSFSPLRSAFVRSILGDLVPEGQMTAPARRGANLRDLAQETRTEERHEATNDRFEDARQIESIPYTARTDTRRTSRDSNEAASCAPAGGTVWYRFTPNRDIALVANTFGTEYASSLGVFARKEGSLQQVACDTDARGNAISQFRANKGLNYFFQIAAPAGGGDLVFNLEPLGRTALLSADRSGAPANYRSSFPSVSGDGRYVAFESQATNMGSGAPDEPCNSHGPYTGTDNELQRAVYPASPCMHVVVRDLTTGKTELISVSSTGAPANSHNHHPVISANGRYVAFDSDADNLVPNDTNAIRDTFVHDRVARRTERVSVSSSEEQMVAPPNGNPWRFIDISADGRFVVFQSDGTNLVEDDTNGETDVFVRDTHRGTTRRVSVSSEGYQGNAESTGPTISANGRYVAFTSAASDFVDDVNGFLDVFVHDLITGRTERVSLAQDGGDGNSGSFIRRSSLSADGRFVAFRSYASNMVQGDTNESLDVFVRDRLAKRTVRANVSSSGDQAASPRRQSSQLRDAGFEDTTLDGSTGAVTLSADGRTVAFHSEASNLVPEDTDQLHDVFLHNLRTRTTTRVSVRSDGRDIEEEDKGDPALSADGRTVAFDSFPAGVGATSGRVYLYERPGMP